MSKAEYNGDLPQLGSLLPETERQRDAIHVAIVPVIAEELLQPGQHVGLSRPFGLDNYVSSAAPHIGIVDPYLTESVMAGDRFYLCLYPGTVTGMRHYWKHPDFRFNQNPIATEGSQND